MNWTNRTVIIFAIVVSCFCALMTGLTIRWLAPARDDSVPPRQGVITVDSRTGSVVAVENDGRIIVRAGNWGGQSQFAMPDPGALADLQAKVKARQEAKETVNEKTISLTSYVNCKLSDPLADVPSEKEHTLAELPSGLHTYGGVPFDVEGIVQLNGPSVQGGQTTWPGQVPNIFVGRAFKKIHLLQGAFNIVSPRGNNPFARLVLRYSDGSQQEFEMAGGIQALRCVDAPVPQELDLLQPAQTELGWLGSNPYLKQNNPSAMLHVYRTTFNNPKPDVPVTSVDFISTMVNPAPFLAALTVE